MLIMSQIASANIYKISHQIGYALKKLIIITANNVGTKQELINHSIPQCVSLCLQGHKGRCTEDTSLFDEKNTHFCHVLHSVPNFLESGLWVSPVVHTQGVGAPTKGHKINLRWTEII